MTILLSLEDHIKQYLSNLLDLVQALSSDQIAILQEELLQDPPGLSSLGNSHYLRMHLFAVQAKLHSLLSHSDSADVDWSEVLGILNSPY